MNTIAERSTSPFSPPDAVAREATGMVALLYAKTMELPHSDRRTRAFVLVDEYEEAVKLAALPEA